MKNLTQTILLTSLLALGLSLTACGDKDPLDTATCDDVCDDTSDPVDTEDTEDTEEPEDTGPEEKLGLQGYAGEFLLDNDEFQSGTEDIYFIGDEGYGDDLCRIRYTMTSTSARADCASCTWAYDFSISDVELVDELAPGCLATVGYDPVDLSALEGETRSYGYDPEYLGHAAVLMQDIGGGNWTVVGFASYDLDSGVFQYNREDGYVTYFE